MDELDLVRLARPEADPPDADALARMKALAFDPPTATVTAASDDLATTDELVELTPIAPKAPHRRRLALVAVAAAIATVGGGLAFATRHTSSGLGTTDTSAGIGGTGDEALSAGLDGRWTIDRAELQGKPVTFDGRTPTAVYADTETHEFGLLFCDSLLGAFGVRDGRLILNPANGTGGLGRCADPSQRAVLEDLQRVVFAGPQVTIDGDRATFRTGEGSFTVRRATAPKPGPPTMAELFGRRFDIDSLRQGEQTVALPDGASIENRGGFNIAIDVGCTLLSGPATIGPDGVLAVDTVVRTANLCTSVSDAAEQAMRELLTARPTVSLANGSLTLVSGSRELNANEHRRLDPVAHQLDGTWEITGASLGSERFELSPGDANPNKVSFDARSGGYAVTMCDTLVGKGFDVPDGRLTLDGTLSGIEGGCTDAVRRRQQDIVVKILTGRPLVVVSLLDATFTAGEDRLTLRRGPSGAATPTMNDLAHRTFGVTSLVQSGRALTISSAATLAVLGGAQLTVDVGCNTMGGDATIADGRLTMPSIGSTLKACTTEQNEANAAVMSLLGGPSEISLAGGTLRVAGGGVELLATEMDAPTTPSTTGNG